MSTPLSESPDGLRLAVRVTPRAGRNAVGGIRDGRLLLKVAAAPEDGKANAAVIKLLARHFGVSPTSIELVSGHTAREKLLLLRGLNIETVTRKLQQP